MDPLNNIALAQELDKRAKGALEEASRRAACGRAYYAAFAFARDLLLGARIQIQGGSNEHREVIEQLKDHSQTVDVRAAGSSLHDLREIRNIADYDVGMRPIRKGGPFDARRSGFALATAKIVIATLREEAQKDPRLGIP